MPAYVALLRGIHVGGRNPVRMPQLAERFRASGYDSVRTYQQSGNVLFASGIARAAEVEEALDELLERAFDAPVPVVVRSRGELARTIASAPAGHGAKDLRSDAFFLKRPLTVAAAMAQMPELRDGVDTITPGPRALYFSRVASHATETRIARFMGMPAFRQITVRTWRTTTRLLELLDADPSPATAGGAAAAG